VIAFGTVTAGNFSLKSSTNILKPGFYSDLTVTVADATSSSAAGLTTVVANQKIGWYYAGQLLGNVTAGAGNDVIAVGPSSSGAVIQTGAGSDTVIVGAFGGSANLTSTVSDFALGVDQLKINGQTVTSANLSSYLLASSHAVGAGSQLVLDLDGAGASTTSYTLNLTNVIYNTANMNTVFGI
jgi:hypothetical protein